jgi:Helicase associated domain
VGACAAQAAPLRLTLADRAAVLESLPGWQWDVPHSRWGVGFGRLRRCVDTHGHAHPPLGTVVDGYPLGQWVRAQRRAHTLGRLLDERIRALESLPGWLWRAR